MLTPKFTNSILKFLTDNNLTWKYIQLQTGWEKTKLSRILTGVDDYTPEDARLLADRLGHDVRYFVQYHKVYGRWISDGEAWHCSICHHGEDDFNVFTISPRHFKYCPYCGSNMQGCCMYDEMFEIWFLESNVILVDEEQLHTTFDLEYQSDPEKFNNEYRLHWSDPHYINPDLIDIEDNTIEEE